MQYKKIAAICLNVVLGIFFVIGVFVVISMLPIKNNFKILTVMSGSMEPKIKTGEMIVVKPKADYNIGEVISFKVLGSDKKEVTITHRISDKKVVDGKATYVTKGDANDASDGNQVTKGQIIGRFLFGLKYTGYFIAYVKTLPGLIMIIVIPATIIIYEEVNKIKKEAKAVLEKRRAKKPATKKTSNSKSASEESTDLEKTKKVPSKKRKKPANKAKKIK